MPRARIESAIESLRHRGPDQQGVFQSPFVSLGAARLKILDLANGDQPIVSPDGDVVICFNGEIYNHLELRPELESLGYRFKTQTDTETVLAAFLHWDSGCFARLRGMFAVALWTESSRRLVLARDRLGIKPLYIARSHRDLYFGSELKTLFLHSEIERTLSLSALDCYLALNYTPGPQSMVESIERLAPATWLEWREGTIRTEKYWHFPPLSPRARSFGEAKEELGSLLRQSVADHLLSDVPLGLWLSGGLDSSTILHYAAQMSSQPIRTYSISFPGRSFDESSSSAQVAAYYGTRHQQLELNEGDDICSAIEQFPDFFDEPNGDGGAVPVWYLSKLTRQTATVAFSGEGADEMFAGYLTHRASDLSRFARALPAPLLRAAESAAARLPVSDDKISFEYKLKRFLAGSLLAPLRGHTFWNGAFSDSEKQSIVRQPLPPALQLLLDSVDLSQPGIEPFLRFDQTYFLPDDILMKIDRISMAHSVEVRPPFLDHRIVEFAASLPGHYKMKGARQKRILRSLMSDQLPAFVLKRPKIGLDFPAHDWLRGPLRELLLDTFSTAEASYAEVFDFAAIRHHMQAHLSRRINAGYHLYGLLTLFLWMNRWQIQCAPSASLKLAAGAGQLITSI